MFGWLSNNKQKKEEKKEDKKEEQDDDDIDESELERSGIDPTAGIQDESKDVALTDFSKEYSGYLILNKEETLSLSVQYKHFDNDGEDIRDELGHKKGGRICNDKAIVSQLRGVFKEIIQQIGRQILTGDMSLTKVSFPIQAMIPKTALQTSVHGSCAMQGSFRENEISDNCNDFLLLLDEYIFKACKCKKFLNPILGETFNGSYPDGTNIYCEQTSHHPPVCYFYVVGPAQSYKYFGYYCYDAKAGLNSLTIYNQGKRYIQFNDGHTIRFDFPNEKYSGTLMGTLKQQSIGKMTFIDSDFDTVCEITIGKVQKRQTDYFSGTIIQEKVEISKISGTYLGYIDFDNIRYWDSRLVTPIRNSPLQSDHLQRVDLQTLKTGDIKQAQIHQEEGQVAQRNDAKLRKEHDKLMAKQQK